MRKIHIITLHLMLLNFTVIAAPTGNSLFSISPSETNLYLSSRGSASVLYSVTNNSRASATPSITLDYESAGKNLTLASNTCDVELAPAGNCTFRVLISGANQPETFTLTPRICGFNGFICSIPPQAVTVKVTRPAAGLPPRAYVEVYNSDANALILKGININNPSDVISAEIQDSNVSSSVNSVAISPDGSKVYATYSDGFVAFFNATSNELSYEGSVNIDSSFSFWSVPKNMQMAITPDGSALFISRYTPPSFDAPPSLFRINLGPTSEQSSVTTFRNIVNTSGLVISPDGKTVYAATSEDYIVALPVDADTNASGQHITGLIDNQIHLGLAIDSAGTTLYVANIALPSFLPEPVISVFSVDGLKGNAESWVWPTLIFNPVGLAISAEGTKLYAAGTDNVKIFSLNDSSPALYSTIPIVGAFGLALSLEGSKLYVTQSGDSSGTTTSIINTADLTTSSIALDGSSSTIGQFIGP